jgi:23S rRNA (cytidine1920-2'-O)/16S rRNA (cytidine1409-2'-O)-methyltransferase
MSSSQPRLDEIVLERGLVADLRTARAVIMRGDVLVDDRVETKAGSRVRAGAVVRLRRERGEYASRGGLKLARALDAFDLDVREKIVLDAGASAGGFTDCLLRRGARKVFAVDVGHGQMDGRLANDARVVNLERTNVSDLTVDRFGTERPSLATVDLSYLSLRKAVPILRALLGEEVVLVCLVKPLFEGLAQGAERDPEALRGVLAALLAEIEIPRSRLRGLVASPILGNRRSVELLAHLGLGEPIDRDAAIERALVDASARHGL